MATILDNAELADYQSKRQHAYTVVTGLLRKLQERKRVKFGVKGIELKRTIDTANNSQLRTIGVGSVLPRNEVIDEAVATFNWSAYHAHRPFDGLLRKRMGGRFQIIDAVTHLIEKLNIDAEQSFSSQLWDGDGNPFTSVEGRSIVGVANVLTSTLTGTYGGIDRAANSYWQHVVVDASAGFEAGAVEFILQAKIEATRDNTDGMFRKDPDCLFVNRDAMQRLWRKAESRNTVIDKKIGDEYEFWGYQVMLDDQISNNRAYLINTDTWELVSTEKMLFNMVEQAMKDAIPGSVAYDLYMQLCLICNSPRHNAVILGTNS